MHPQGPNQGWGAPYAPPLPPPPPPHRNNGAIAVVIIGFVVLLVAAVGAGAFLLLRHEGSDPVYQAPLPVASPLDPGDESTDGKTPDEPGTAAANPIEGIWQGTYTCPQGDTGLRLTIKAVNDRDLTATFAFSAVSSNPGVPSGSFAMRGTLLGGKLNLIGDHWIKQPAGYEMVSLQAPISNPKGGHFTGTIDSTSCRTFSVRRVS